MVNWRVRTLAKEHPRLHQTTPDHHSYVGPVEGILFESGLQVPPSPSKHQEFVSDSGLRCSNSNCWLTSKWFHTDTESSSMNLACGCASQPLQIIPCYGGEELPMGLVAMDVNGEADTLVLLPVSSCCLPQAFREGSTLGSSFNSSSRLGPASPAARGPRWAVGLASPRVEHGQLALPAACPPQADGLLPFEGWCDCCQIPPEEDVQTLE